MLGAKARAALTAPKNNLQGESCRNDLPTSRKNLQQDIGKLLWSLQFSVGCELQQRGCELFERLLRRYVGLRGLSQCVQGWPESTKSVKGGIG